MLFLLGILGFIVVVQAASAWDTRCPNCSRPWAQRSVAMTPIGQRSVTRRVWRRDFGEGSSGHWEDVEFTHTTFRNDYECKYCGHSWSSTSES
ncbi:MAG TPA: hypothetical protein VNI01_09375 [Elusimicrobiota bacterium]|nr:hypothetical protein [Elusimicrobiota bacterium]